MTGKPRIWPVLLAAGLGLVILLSLGTWQVQRLKWKEGLLAQLSANAAADPVDLATAERLINDGRNIEFLRVRFRAAYKLDAGKAMISTYDGGPGWTVITPAITPERQAVIVDRGQVPGDHLANIDKPGGEVEVNGIVRLYPNGKGYFDPQNDAVRDAWYWWDVPAMLQASHLPPDATPMPFVVQLLPGDTMTAEFPRPSQPRANLRNSHLSYAITWFGLAVVLVVISGLYIRGAARKSSA